MQQSSHRRSVTFQIRIANDFSGHYLLKLSNKLSELHFVSCGIQGVETLPFSEFFVVFDIYIFG